MKTEHSQICKSYEDHNKYLSGCWTNSVVLSFFPFLSNLFFILSFFLPFVLVKEGSRTVVDAVVVDVVAVPVGLSGVCSSGLSGNFVAFMRHCMASKSRLNPSSKIFLASLVPSDFKTSSLYLLLIFCLQEIQSCRKHRIFKIEHRGLFFEHRQK